MYVNTSMEMYTGIFTKIKLNLIFAKLHNTMKDYKKPNSLKCFKILKRIQIIIKLKAP